MNHRDRKVIRPSLKGDPKILSSPPSVQNGDRRLSVLIAEDRVPACPFDQGAFENCKELWISLFESPHAHAARPHLSRYDCSRILQPDLELASGLIPHTPDGRDGSWERHWKWELWGDPPTIGTSHNTE